MKLDANDPKLTAYALGELDASERAEVEEALKADEESRRAVEEIRQVGEMLRAELGQERSPGLSEQHRKAIEAALVARRGRVTLFRRIRSMPWIPAAFAACLFLGFAALHFLSPQVENRKCANNTVQLAANPILAATKGKDSDEQMCEPRKKYLGPTPPRPPKREVVSPYSHNVPFEMFEVEDAPVKKDHSWDGAIVSNGRPTHEEKDLGGGRRSRRLLGEDANLKLALRSGEEQATLSEDLQSLDQPVPEQHFGPSMPDYAQIAENPFLKVTDHPLSTFSIDVDTASYAIVRNFLNGGQLPPKDAVRIEEMVNYFTYDYSPPTGDVPFSVHTEIAQCPWATEHRLARIGLKGKEISEDERSASNLVFLLDVSGSMEPENKLPLLKRAMALLAGRLNDKDRVAIAVYAGASGLVLPSTVCNSEGTGSVLAALDRLQSGGSTNGGAGIQLAYDLATRNFIKGGTNRVILATDGDFNVGVTNRGDLVRMVEEKAKSGIFLTVLGFGMGNLKDSTLEQLADKGNGNYAYIDTFEEARKVFVHQLAGTLVTIAKDVKIQIEFNPKEVAAYRLVGYENRILAKEDFNDDKKDAGDIGAGHTVTALYELVPADQEVELPRVDPLKYQDKTRLSKASGSGELMTVKLRYKEPDGETSSLIEFPARDSGRRYAKASDDFKFAAAVASFGMLLRDSQHKGNTTYDAVLELADEAKGKDREGYRAEFIGLVKAARGVKSEK
jgi:Ca-activated chloride channel family protein